MGLFQKLKSALGLSETRSSGSGHSEDVDVTVERAPSTEDEDAVKGTETASSETEAAADSADGESDDQSAEEFETPADETDAELDADTESNETADAGDGVEAAERTAPVTELKGIGPTYSDKLASADIETVSELAGADAAAIAEETDLSESRITGWIEKANDY
jgi:predicted flap endonuclease-1-like 5' DNA nuclease